MVDSTKLPLVEGDEDRVVLVGTEVVLGAETIKNPKVNNPAPANRISAKTMAATVISVLMVFLPDLVDRNASLTGAFNFLDLGLHRQRGQVVSGVGQVRQPPPLNGHRHGGFPPLFVNGILGAKPA
jgi:hypothetical protein